MKRTCQLRSASPKNGILALYFLVRRQIQLDDGKCFTGDFHLFSYVPFYVLCVSPRFFHMFPEELPILANVFPLCFPCDHMLLICSTPYVSDVLQMQDIYSLNLPGAFVPVPWFSYSFRSFPMCLPIYFRIFSQFSHGLAIFSLYFPHIFPSFHIFPVCVHVFLQLSPLFARQARHLAPASSKLPGAARRPPLAPAAQGMGESGVCDLGLPSIPSP